MDFLGHLQMAFSIAFEPMNLLMCFIGVLLGTLVGVLPGLGPVAAMSGGGEKVAVPNESCPHVAGMFGLTGLALRRRFDI